MVAWPSPSRPCSIAASITASYTGALYCLIRLFDGDSLRLAASPNFPPEAYERIASIDVHAHYPSRAPQRRVRRCSSPRRPPKPRPRGVADLANALGIVATWSVPIELPNRNAVAGTLTLLFDTNADNRDEQRPLVERMVSLAAVAIEQAQARDELEHRAFHDELTGLPNRALLNDRLNHALQRSPRRDAAVAVVFFDLDRFKLVNDSLGHDAGDRLLVQVAKRLRAKLRASDTVGRLGGDEFVVLVDDVHAESDAHAAVQRVVDILEQPFEVDGETIFVSASVGVAIRGDASQAADVLREADDAMYRAKQRGRGSVEYQATSGTASSVNPLARITALHRALERDELVVHYQPIVDIASRQPVSEEALVRWNHPELGLVLPGEFIPLAEDTGLIIPLGWRVLEHVMRRLAAPARSRRRGERVGAPAFGSRLRSATHRDDRVAAAQRPHARDHRESVDRRPRAASPKRSPNSPISAYGSRSTTSVPVSRVSRISDALPIHQLKIDRSFVAGLGERPECEALVSGIIHLGEGLGLEVIAEGVETAQQAERLLDLGARLAQGYLFGRPQQWNRKSLHEERLAERPVLRLVEPRTA